ncbi:MAG TPA: Gfo/Idh/MocA family oxidoreductase [Aggregatilineales bacterium]|nr:Gfo/Idh/MocA family oxidoreductase [Aggregatilineales bacterium]
MSDLKINAAVVGCGYWGPNLIRNITQSSDIHLRALCDLNEAKLTKQSSLHHPDYATQNFDEILNDAEIEAVVVATSANTHHALVKAALEANKHVLVEKPLALQSEHAAELTHVAADHNRCLMVGHTFQYNPAVNKVRELIQSGDLGEIIYAYMTRVNLGIIRDDLNVMWNLAPHDISILLYTFGSLPVRISARGFSPLRPNSQHMEDIVFMVLEFENGAVAHIHNSWLDPNKIRSATFVGTEKMVVYDDVDSQRRIQIFDKGVVQKDSPVSFGEFQLTVRDGDILIPKVPTTEPLKAEIAHFVDCIRTGAKPISDGENGWQVVRIMEAADLSIEQMGAVIELNWDDSPGASR